MIFQLDTSGSILLQPSADAPWETPAITWTDLSPFVQGYIEAVCRSGGGYNPATGNNEPWDFRQLAPETLERTMSDCALRMSRAGIVNQSSAGAAFWAARQGKFRKQGYPAYFTLPEVFPPLILSLNEAGKVVFS